MPYEHLRIAREEPLTDRHRRPVRIPRFRPEDPRAFGEDLRRKLLAETERDANADIGGFDDRRLLKIKLRVGESMPDFDAIPGVTLVSQEDATVVLAFASEEGLGTFESRLATLAQNGNVTRAALLYAIEDFDRWTTEDRKGAALRKQGFPQQEPFVLDVELWPVERQDERDQLLAHFDAWRVRTGLERLDAINQPSLVMLRLRCTAAQASSLLDHRDVRTVDLPPSVGVAVDVLLKDLGQFPAVERPPDGAPAVAVLDSGITSGHPHLAAAVGDVQGFVDPLRDVTDRAPCGHGTFVAGLALYGNVQGCIQQRSFVPRLRLYSGKVFEDDGRDQTRFVESAVDEAVRYFRTEYGCKVFNLSYGDRNKVYDSKHVRGLAYTLDRLSRELDVLFVVPTGNLLKEELPADARQRYPEYLLEESSRVLDPAPALIPLTVGGLAMKDAGRQAQRHPDTVEEFPIAAIEEPSPFTRSGPGPVGAIKPDLVEEAGNFSVMRLGNDFRHLGLGLVSMNSGFAAGTLFTEDVGTSFAAPVVAQKAARLLEFVPDASANLLRALLAAHAHWPQASLQLLNPNNEADKRSNLLKLIGYGRVDDGALYESVEKEITLYSEDRIDNDKHHFYELPLPEDFWDGGRRSREITVALAYSPAVRTTRLDYRQTKISFSLVIAASLDEVARAHTHGRGQDDAISERITNRSIPSEERKKGTLQMSRWTFVQRSSGKVFIVVTRQDAAWSRADDQGESYALAVGISDRQNTSLTADLYVSTQAVLTARAQARARARV